MIDAVCIWDPVYRLQFIGLGRAGVGEEEVLIMLEGKRCFARACLLVFPYLSCQRELNHPWDSLPVACLWSDLHCSVVAAGHTGWLCCALGSGSPGALASRPVAAPPPRPCRLS